MTYNPDVSPRLADMVRRCALPIHVVVQDYDECWLYGVWLDKSIDPDYESTDCSTNPAEATTAYLALVSTLETESAASTSAVTGDGCSAPASPGGES